jgi:phage-related minor tail protein
MWFIMISYYLILVLTVLAGQRRPFTFNYHYCTTDQRPMDKHVVTIYYVTEMEPRDQTERDAVAAFLAKRRKAEERKARQEAKRKAEEEEKKRLEEEAEIRRAEEEKRKEEEARRKEEEAREQKEEEERAEREARRQKEEQEGVEREARGKKEGEDSDENDSEMEEEPKQKKAKTEKTEEDVPVITYFPDDVSITSSEPSIGTNHPPSHHAAPSAQPNEAAECSGSERD